MKKDQRENNRKLRILRYAEKLGSVLKPVGILVLARAAFIDGALPIKSMAKQA